MVRDGTLRFQADAGVVVRRYEVSASAVSFQLHCTRPVTVTSTELEGKLKVKVDGLPVISMARKGMGVSLAVPAGVHSILISAGAI
jgi:hypothetical protein